MLLLVLNEALQVEFRFQQAAAQLGVNAIALVLDLLFVHTYKRTDERTDTYTEGQTW